MTLMDPTTKFTKAKWANGHHSITITPYAHTQNGFQSVLNKLAEKFKFDMPRAEIIGSPAAPEKLDYWAEFTIDGHQVVLAMDWFKCSIATPDEKLRDKILASLI